MDEAAPSWVELVAAVPWLSAIPAAIAGRLDRSEYLLPAGDIEAERRRLEHVLDAHVMTYRRVRLAQPTGPDELCRFVVPATVDAAGLSELRRAEQRFVGEGLLFSAYARPLVLTSN
jgi:hypothetical protein